MLHSKLMRALILAGLLIVVSTTLVSAATFLLLETGRGTVDGNPNEWGDITTSNRSVNPYYITDLCVNGDCVNQPGVGRLYAHYTCENNVLYFIVAAYPPLIVTVSAANNFLAQDTPGNVIMSGGTPFTTNTDQNGPIWRYLTTGGSGFEGGYPFQPGRLITLYFQAYINTTPGVPQNVSTGVHNYIVPGCGTTAVTLSSFNAQSDASDWLVGLGGIVGLIALASVGVVLWRRWI